MGCRNCKFSPQDFRTKIVIEQISQVQDDTGGFTDSWSQFANPWAKVVEKHGNERLISQRIDAVDTYQFTIRAIPGVTESMRVIHRGLTLQIKSVIYVDGRKEFMQIKTIDEGPKT